MSETVLCAVTWSPTGWRGPSERAPDEDVLGSFVEEHRWGAEDWIFATAPEQLVGGKLYSYVQGDPSPKRVEAAKGRFHVFFYARRPADGHVGLVGLYRNARYVTDDERATFWKRMKAAEVTARRAAQLRDAFADPARGKQESAWFLKSADVRWIVRRADVHVFENMPAIEAPSWHPDNAHRAAGIRAEDQALLARLLDEADPSAEEASMGFPLPSGSPDEILEGRRVQRLHLIRERNSAMAREYRAQRLLSGPPPHFACDACDVTLLTEHGRFAIDGFDVHHQVPLKKAPKSGTLTSKQKLCILCVRCHRLAHASGRFTVPELRDFLTNPTS